MALSPYEYDLARMRARAAVLSGHYRTPLVLVSVQYPDMRPRVSILGGSISPAMADIWRQQGAMVTEIETIPSTYKPLPEPRKLRS